MLANFTVPSLMYITFLSLETLESGQMESYFTNHTIFLKLRGFPISLPQNATFFRGVQKPVVCISVAYQFDEVGMSWSKLFEPTKNLTRSGRFRCEKDFRLVFIPRNSTRVFWGSMRHAPNAKGSTKRPGSPFQDQRLVQLISQI